MQPLSYSKLARKLKPFMQTWLADIVQFSAAAPTDHGALAGLSDDDHLQYWLDGGRSGGAVLQGGTTDDYAVEILVNSARAQKWEPHATSPNTVGGYSGNSISSGSYGCGIGSGGNSGSEIAITGAAATSYSFIGGGEGHSLSGVNSFIGGGKDHTISDDYTFIGGGSENSVTDSHGAIAGGYSNVVSGQYGFIGGGYDCTVSGYYGVIPGGVSNEVTASNGYAAGNRAKAIHSGAYVWADATAADFSSAAANSYNVRAGGGMICKAWTSRTNSVQAQLTLGHNTSATPVSGYGIGITALCETSTTEDQYIGRLRWYWSTATHASRAARGVLSAYDYGGERDCVLVGGDGTQSLVGFHGTGPIAQPAAYTQTFSGTTRTHNNATATTVSWTSTNISPWGYSTQAEADAIPTAVNNLITDVRNVKELLNQVIDDLQSYGLLQ